jgi:hypothetical protein
MTRRVAFVLVGALVIGACSSSHHNAAPPTSLAFPTLPPPTADRRASTTTAPAPPPTAAPATAPSASDQRIVDSVVLKVSDLPNGVWKVGPDQTNDETGDTQLSACLGVPNSDLQETAYKGSPQFAQGATEAYSAAHIYSSAALVRSDVSALSKPQFTQCLTRDFETQTGATNVRIVKLALPAALSAYQGFEIDGRANITSGGTFHHLLIGEVGLAKGRIESDVSVVTVDGIPPIGLVARLGSALAARLGATST